MFATAVIAFREFLEAFLIVGVFFGISKKLKLKKEIEISIAALLGIIVSLVLASVTYVFGDYARGILTQRNADILESYLLIFSGFFLAYVIFSLHNTLRRSRGLSLLKAHQKLQENIFDFSLFVTIVLLVVREGFEVALFTATTSLFTAFTQNVIGLLLGFLGATVSGILAFYAYVRFPIGKIFKVTEYMIIFLGASLLQNGLTQLFALHFNIKFSNFLPVPLSFLPSEETLFGHLLKSFLGVDREFSLARLAIMGMYIGAVYLLFFRQHKKIIS